MLVNMEMVIVCLQFFRDLSLKWNKICQDKMVPTDCELCKDSLVCRLGAEMINNTQNKLFFIITRNANIG